MEDLDSNAQVHANSLKRKSCFLLSILVACYCLSGQPPKSTDRKAQKFYDKAVAAQKERNFGEAIQLLKKAVKRDLTFSGAIVKIGNLYMRLGNDDSSYHYYKVYCSATSNPALSILETCALMSFDRGLYEEASAFLNRLRARDSSLVEREDLFLLQQSLAFAAEQLTNPDSINFEELPTSVNGFKLQYLPAITADGAQLFYTKRDQVSGDEDIVVSHRDGNTWTEARSVSNRINTPLNEGACTISADGRKMIFTSCDRRDAFGSCDLYISTKKGKYWSKPRNLGKPVNTKYWESQPALSADGRTLYFSSLRPEGKGARDIWVSSQIDGKWSKPKNLSRINTAKDETTPYIHSNGTSLFFSSNGYPGMGGFDLYIWNLADTAATPSNLGYPINSFRDEVALITASNGTDAYLAKEELKNKQILESKIYKLTFPEENRTPPAYYVKGIVLDKQKRTPMKALVEVYDLEIGERLFAAKSDSITGSYFFVLPTDRKIGAYVKKEGFLFKDFSFDVKENDLTNIDSLTILMEPIAFNKSLVLQNIYFETNSHKLNDDSQVALENLAEFLRLNPEAVIEISGHTDNQGTDTYNEQLSNRRANSVRDRLIQLGANPESINAKGYGSKNPIATNADELGRKSNRRIEMRVLRSDL